MREINITGLDDFRIGSFTDDAAKTGVTVVICEQAGVCGVDIRGGSPATREVVKLNPINTNKITHAICFSGGSSFGLSACDGVVRFLEERGIGRDVGVTSLPNVVGSSIFDLKVGGGKIRPDANMGYAACEDAYVSGKLQNGRFGAGTGATVGKALGLANVSAGGIGFAAYQYETLTVGAIVVVNSVGDIVKNGSILAGTQENGIFLGTEKLLIEAYQKDSDLFKGSESTVLSAVITNADLDTAAMTRVAMHGQNGVTRAIYPAHMICDGDICFAICSGKVQTNQDAAGILAARAVEEAIYRAVSPQSLRSGGRHGASRS
jgi:L-aminopeptidase/D-esterase-like protein